MDKLRVLLADDHAVVREGLRSLIDAQPDLEVVGEAQPQPTYRPGVHPTVTLELHAGARPRDHETRVDALERLGSNVRAGDASVSIGRMSSCGDALHSRTSSCSTVSGQACDQGIRLVIEL